METLQIEFGQYSQAGVKPLQQDCSGCKTPTGTELTYKGIAIALADGISSSQVSHIASQSCVNALLDDYYATPAFWGVSTSVKKVLQSLNSWLYAQSRRSEFRYQLDRGYVCTLSALVLRSCTATLFHVGDSRICRLSGRGLEPLTEDHRSHATEQGHYLTRAMGMREHLDLQVIQTPLEVGDCFVLMTDGVYEWLSSEDIAKQIHKYGSNLQAAAESIVACALGHGSDDNLTIQIVRITQLPSAGLDELNVHQPALPIPDILHEGDSLDGYRIQRVLHANHRSRVYLVSHPEHAEPLVLKVPTPGMREQDSDLDQFLKEIWIAQRVSHPILSQAVRINRPRQFCYLPLTYFPSQTLAQWRQDQGPPGLTQIRNIVSQAAKGLQAMHRMHMVHQDIRPQNILINEHGQVRLVDYGATRIEGLVETEGVMHEPMLGELQYAAPERLLGWRGTEQSDLYSLACVVYFLLSGQLPYPAALMRARTRSAQLKLRYRSLAECGVDIPVWVDQTLRKALQLDPSKRHQALSEFVYDLHHPNPKLTVNNHVPLLEKDPVAFWQTLCALLLLLLLLLAGTHPGLETLHKSSSITGPEVSITEPR